MPQSENKRKIHNVTRTAYRTISRLGIVWKIPLDIHDHFFEDGEHLPVHFLHPAKILQFVTANNPELVFGGGDDGGVVAFWEAFRHYHNSHEVYGAHSGHLNRVIPIALHGDEGRGKRRSSTTVFSFESVLGAFGDRTPCSTCAGSRVEAYQGDPRARRLVCNLQGHSFLQHYPLFVIPGVLAKEYKGLVHEMVQKAADMFYQLFHEGFMVNDQRYYAAVIGSKGDLKWMSLIAKLTRGYEFKGRVRDLPSCHQCLAGHANFPAESLGQRPEWLSTMFVERPWDEGSPESLPDLIRIPFDGGKPEWLYKHDVFHVLRLGVFRDFAASVILLLLRWDHFGSQGDLDTKLQGAHGHFRLWQQGSRKKASLRSFSKNLFTYKTKKSYPYANVKASDCSLILQWLVVLVIGILTAGPPQEQLEVLNTILATCRLAISFYDLITSHNMFLDKACAVNLFQRGQSFVNGYVYLARWSLDHHHCLFALKPKLHFHKHILEEIKAQLDAGSTFVLNPLIFDCCRNEDLIGRICKISRKIDGRILHKRVLENFLIKAGILARHAAKDQAPRRRRRGKASCPPCRRW